MKHMMCIVIACLATAWPASVECRAGAEEAGPGEILRIDQRQTIEKQILEALGREWRADRKQQEQMQKNIGTRLVYLSGGSEAKLRGAKIGSMFTVESEIVKFTVKGASIFLFDSGGAFVLNETLAGLSPGTRITRTDSGKWYAEAPGTWTVKAADRPDRGNDHKNVTLPPGGARRGGGRRAPPRSGDGKSLNATDHGN